MTEQTWRLDPIGRGHIAWVYLIPHACDWTEVASVVEQSYAITEERQNLVDDELGACIRYLAVRAG